jgi:hypothetical protein
MSNLDNGFIAFPLFIILFLVIIASYAFIANAFESFFTNVNTSKQNNKIRS